MFHWQRTQPGLSRPGRACGRASKHGHKNCVRTTLMLLRRTVQRAIRIDRIYCNLQYCTGQMPTHAVPFFFRPRRPSPHTHTAAENTHYLSLSLASLCTSLSLAHVLASCLPQRIPVELGIPFNPIAIMLYSRLYLSPMNYRMD